MQNGGFSKIRWIQILIQMLQQLIHIQWFSISNDELAGTLKDWAVGVIGVPFQFTIQTVP